MIRYQTSTDAITPERLQGFFVGWQNPPTPGTHLRLLRNSDHVVFVIEGVADGIMKDPVEVFRGLLAEIAIDHVYSQGDG